MIEAGDGEAATRTFQVNDAMTTPAAAPQAPHPAAFGRNAVIFVAVSALIIGNFLYRLVAPAHEYPMRSEQVLDIGLDILLLAALLGMKRQAAWLQVLFWIALAAAIGSLLIRVLGGDASWWTGHLVYYIEPR
ncbi:MAG TPA: hypothetical protein VGG57_01755 [Stellaceae bacterium]|jgi:hypothetical protein